MIRLYLGKASEIMKKRIEYKYLIEDHQYNQIRRTLSRFSELDGYAISSEGYKISSIYFDSPRFRCHSEWVGGQCERFKLRLRWYPGKGELYKLEIKRKSNFRVYKHVCMLCHSEAVDILRGDIPDSLRKQEHMSDFVHYLFASEGFKPVVKVDYNRLPFFYKYDHDIRFTIDSDIRYSRCGALRNAGLSRPLMPSHLRVLEVKSTSYLPDFVKNMINTHGLRKESVSKYSNAIHGIKLNSEIVI